MKKITTLITLLFVLYGYSQINPTQEQIDNLPENVRALYQRITQNETLRKNRLNQFFDNNNNYLRIYSDEGKTYVAYDIIDGAPIYRTTDNLDAATATRTIDLQPGGSLGLNLDGTGLTVAVWDGGPVQQNHVEFQNANNTGTRIQNFENLDTSGNPSQDSHATHVSGTIAAKGVLATAKGMAPNIDVITYNFNDDNSEMLSLQAFTTTPIYLSNHSYGIPFGNVSTWFAGAYTSGARQIDDLAYNYPNYLIVMSAGNSGNATNADPISAGLDKLTGDKNSKNNLVIANANPNVNPFSGVITLSINSSSSQGPTDDLRIKPDLAGDGTGLTSPTPTDSYSVFSGTSMSSPNVTGSLALIQQYYNQLNGNVMKASTLKALACHTALDDALTTGPDPIYGWGLLDARKAAETITDHSNGQSIIEENSLNNNSTYSTTFNTLLGDNISATICWTDVPGTAVSGPSSLNDQTPRLVNDLDIRISKDGITYFPWRLDLNPTSGISNSKADNIRDNVERIDFTAPTSGTYTITVSHKGSLQGLTAFDPKIQDYSLIVTGNNLTLSNNDNSISNNLKIYPNPTNNLININANVVDDKSEITIIDIKGRIIYREDVNSTSNLLNHQIDISKLNSGVYFVSLKNGSAALNSKFIKN